MYNQIKTLKPESLILRKQVRLKDFQAKRILIYLGPFWKIAIRGCPPDSLARRAIEETDFSKTPEISLKYAAPFLHQGYIQNFTMSADFCNQPDLQSLHGMMINPLSVSTTKVLIPMFGGSKLPTNNEILLPAPMYWNNEERFSGGDNHGPPWSQKHNKVIWRGVATGGLNTPNNWKGFQRHRFVSQTNATEITNAERRHSEPQNWAVPPKQYNLAAQQEGKLGEWTRSWSDTAFVDLMCLYSTPGGHCNYTGEYFSVEQGLTMAQQFDNKYVPDIDGNSFSGRYRGFLLSTSLPIKATIFREWHDSRLVPWKHFVPMDNRFLDFWGIMEYFLGFEGYHGRRREGHDKEAEKIALAGQEWANKVLRPEDMQIYVFRVLLEYARVTADGRDKMGFVGDLS